MTLLTVKDLAARLQVKEKTIYAWASHGKLPCMRIEGVIRFDPREVEKWLQNRQVAIGPPCKSSKSKRQESVNLTGVDLLVERAKRAVYTPERETKPVASPFQRGGLNGTL